MCLQNEILRMQSTSECVFAEIAGVFIMTPTTTKRGRGRPLKQPENPDCEVATRGYVKCLMRKMTDIQHTHGTTNGEPTENIGIATMALSFASVIGWLLASKCEYTGMVTMFASLFWMSLVMFSACAFNASVIVDKAMLSDHIPDFMQKYEPPCEPE